jgi:hypothetical protein
MYRKLLSLIFLSIQFCLNAQNSTSENVYPIQTKIGMNTYIDRNGKVIFSLDSLTAANLVNKYFYTGYLSSTNGNTQGISIFDNKGKKVREIKGVMFSDPYSNPFQDGIAVVSEYSDYNKKGIVDFEGNILVKPSLENKGMLYAGQGLFVRKKGTQFEFLDKNGKIIFTKPQSQNPSEYFYKFSEGLSKFSSSVTVPDLKYQVQTQGYFDLTGNTVIEPKQSMNSEFSQGLAFLNFKEGSKFINKKGEIAIPKFFNSTSFTGNGNTKFSEGLANVMDVSTNKAGYINSKGEWAIEPNYKKASCFLHGLGVVLNEDDLVQVLNKDGKVILEGYWGDNPRIWWDENIIYVGYLDTYFDHQGKIIWEQPNPFMQISNLKQLDNIKNLEKVKSIFLINHELGSPLPSKLWDCKNVEQITLSDYKNQVNFPTNFYEFKNLKYLSISVRYLNQLPDGISKLENLNNLEVKNSNLTKLPKDFGSLKKIYNLDLSGNKISEIPKSIGNLKTLSMLNLSSNPIKILPETIYSLPKLEMFTFEHASFIEDEAIISKLSQSYPKAYLTSRVAKKANAPSQFDVKEEEIYRKNK